jgi:hypothetical protein
MTDKNTSEKAAADKTAVESFSQQPYDDYTVDPFAGIQDPLAMLVRYTELQPRSVPPRDLAHWNPVIRVDSASLYPTMHVLQGRFAKNVLIYEGPITGRGRVGDYSIPASTLAVSPDLIVSPSVAELIVPGCLADLKDAYVEYEAKKGDAASSRRLESAVRVVESAGSVIFLGTDPYGSPRSLIREEDADNVPSIQASWVNRHLDASTGTITPPNNAVTDPLRRKWLQKYSIRDKSGFPPWYRAFESVGASFAFAFIREPATILSIDNAAREDAVSELSKEVSVADCAVHLLAGHASHPPNIRDADSCRLATLDLVSAIHFGEVESYPEKQSGDLPDSFWG